MQAIIINGSPRGRQSNSKIMSDYFEDGLHTAGVTTETIFLTECRLEYCRGCFGCWRNSDERCVIQDDMHSLITKCMSADYVIYTAPVYFYTMPAILKNFIDRLLPLASPQIIKNERGEFYHASRYTKFPKMVLLTSCGFPGDGNFEGIKVAFTFLNPVAIICRNQGGLLRIVQSPVKELVESYGQLLKTAAIELVEQGCISEKLNSQLTTSLISDETYTAVANQSWK